MLAEKSLGGGTDAEPVLKLLAAAVSYPCNLGSEALNVILFLLEQAFGNEHRHANIFVTCSLEHTVKYSLDIFPYSIAVRTYYHTALNACIFNKLSLFAYVCVPFCEILVHRGNGVNHFFIVLCHFGKLLFIAEVHSASDFYRVILYHTFPFISRGIRQFHIKAEEIPPVSHGKRCNTQIRSL